jgi:hypothetical protein
VAPSLAKSLPLPRILRRLVGELVIADRERRGSDFAHVTRWPERIAGFEDLTFLFSSTVLAHGIASLRFDEAALLYRLVRELQPNLVVEIGRYRGGSTLLLAAHDAGHPALVRHRHGQTRRQRPSWWLRRAPG